MPLSTVSRWSPRQWTLGGLTLLLLAGSAWAAADWYTALPPQALAQATYAGRPTCVECHEQEGRLWTGSDHDRAMEMASEASVLGDFDDAEFSRFGVTTRFFRQGEKYMVHTEGPDGASHDYEVKYTFGVDPLQQYMVEFPDGRVQVLRESWDARKNEWFYVAPVDAGDMRLEPDDPLHWTGLGQNWNTMCADCHSTDFKKNYDLAGNSYHSTFFEIDVSCEMCHGPGSVHVEIARSKGLFWDRRHGYGLVNKLKGGTADKQIETCGPCHSRRMGIHENYRAGESYFDYFDPSLLIDGLYHADGQILDEVYVYGSFLQSRMYREGVRCTDCHNPHSLQLKFAGNQLCGQCHQPGRYDAPTHHHHTDEAATQCVNCHMPSRVYMGIDDRRDHSLRVPRPDLSVALGTPNACNDCHVKPTEDAAWAAAAVVRWYGDKRPDDPHYARAIDAAWRMDPQADKLLIKTLERPQTSPMVRATAIELLARYSTTASLKARRDALDDRHPLVRAAAVRSLPVTPNSQSIDDVTPRLDDWARIVRFAAANQLVGAANELANTSARDKLESAIAEYREAQAMHLDRAAAHMNLAQLSITLAAAAGERQDATSQKRALQDAVASLRQAIRLEDYLTGPRGLLALVLDQIASNPQWRDLPEVVDARRQEIENLRRAEAENLARDEKLLPLAPEPHYRRGMLLYLLGEVDEARVELLESCRLAPNEYNNWLALALICEHQQRWQEAHAALERMEQLRPGDPAVQGIAQRIEQTRGGPDSP